MKYKVIIEDATQGIMGGGAMESATSTLTEKSKQSHKSRLRTHWRNCS